MIIDDFEKAILAANLNNKLAVTRICRQYLEAMREKYSVQTVKAYCTRCRKIIQANCSPSIAESACQILKLDSQEYHRLNKEYRENVYSRSWDQKESIDSDHFIQVCMDQIEGYWETHKSYQRLAIGIAGLTGRRFFGEVLGFGRFKVIGLESLQNGSDWKHQKPAHIMMFSGQSKIRGSGKEPYAIPVLGNPELIYQGWRVLREEKKVIPKDFPDQMKYLTNESYKISLKRHYELYLKYREEIMEINVKLKCLNGAVTKILRPLFNRTDLQVKDLRSIYANICYKQFKPKGDKNPYISMILGHSEYDYSTAQSYKNFED